MHPHLSFRGAELLDSSRSRCEAPFSFFDEHISDFHTTCGRRSFAGPATLDFSRCCGCTGNGLGMPDAYGDGHGGERSEACGCFLLLFGWLFGRGVVEGKEQGGRRSSLQFTTCHDPTGCCFLFRETIPLAF